MEDFVQETLDEFYEDFEKSSESKLRLLIEDLTVSDYDYKSSEIDIESPKIKRKMNIYKKPKKGKGLF